MDDEAEQAIEDKKRAELQQAAEKARRKADEAELARLELAARTVSIDGASSWQIAAGSGKSESGRDQRPQLASPRTEKEKDPKKEPNS